jgi:hypothetical protein
MWKPLRRFSALRAAEVGIRPRAPPRVRASIREELSTGGVGGEVSDSVSDGIELGGEGVVELLALFGIEGRGTAEVWREGEEV